jgi:hypothetical protein
MAVDQVVADPEEIGDVRKRRLQPPEPVVDRLTLQEHEVVLLDGPVNRRRIAGDQGGDEGERHEHDDRRELPNGGQVVGHRSNLQASRPQ